MTQGADCIASSGSELRALPPWRRCARPRRAHGSLGSDPGPPRRRVGVPPARHETLVSTTP